MSKALPRPHGLLNIMRAEFKESEVNQPQQEANLRAYFARLETAAEEQRAKRRPHGSIAIAPRSKPPATGWSPLRPGSIDCSLAFLLKCSGREYH